ncbi:Golgi complex component Cog3 [Pseudohyphozyma bogoriensis]|nr:Golgi complex component Cog3 [Pseudohyphozyma bogoriensis]
MASVRASTSRLSLEDWDSLAPLSTRETSSASRVNTLAQDKPLPPKLAALHQPTSRPTTPTPLHRKGSRIDLATLLNSPGGSPRPSSAAAPSRPLPITSETSESVLDLAEPIATTQQFHDWFARVEQGMEREQEEIYRTHLSELDEYIESCEMVLEQLDDARGLLSEMEANYRFVEDNSRALQLACETMLDEQKHLIEVTEAIGARLEYFRELETATRMLNLPGETLVLQDDFLNMLDRLDVSLDYLKANRDFKDAEIYIIRFQQCLTRAMTLIKMYFVSVIRKLTSEVQEKMTGKELSETALTALLFTKFSSTAETLRILIFELEKRARIEPTEYNSLLQDCYSTWFASRGALLAGTLAEEIRRMDPGSADLIKLARTGCNHLRSVAMSEWSLYRIVFTTGEPQLYSFLESLCDYLYDSLRPRILHEPKLEVLCELCTVLGAMMALDVENGASDDEDDSDAEREEADDVVALPGAASKFSNIASARNSISRLKFSQLLQTILQDSQTRLVFRAQAVIQSEVLYFVPAPADLDYPKKLVTEGGASGEAEGALGMWTEDERLRDAEIGGFRVPREEVMGSWYPSLKRTVWVLSKLNTYVNNTIFEDFAGEAVTLCRQSLTSASNQISTREGNSKIDGQLFLIRHLLLLKEMVRSVDMVHIERAADFSTVTDALVNLLKNTSVIFNPNALFELAAKGIPSFAETMTDAKTDLDKTLKEACESLISDSSATIALPIRAFLDKCTTYLSSPTGKDLPSQLWATSEAVIKLHEEFQATLEAQAGEVVGKLKVYLNDRKTIGVLLPPLLEEIVDTYSTYYNLIRSEYDFATSSSLLTPTVVKDKLVAVQ